MKLLIGLFFALLSYQAKATFYSQVFAGLVKGESTGGEAEYTGYTTGVKVGKRFGFLALEGTFEDKRYGLNSGQAVGSLTKAEYEDKQYSLGMRLFFGRFLTAATGVTTTRSNVTTNNGTPDDVVTRVDGRSGGYGEADLRYSGKKGSFFIRYRVDSIEKIENPLIPAAARLSKNESFMVGLSVNFSDLKGFEK